MLCTIHQKVGKLGSPGIASKSERLAWSALECALHKESMDYIIVPHR